MLEGTGSEDYLLPHLRLLSNPYTQFKRFVKKAGLVPWPKLWQNLRSTRETELMENKDFSLQAVCQWIGNSPVVALKHYAQVREHKFHIATGSEDEKALQKALQNEAGALQSAAFQIKEKESPNLDDSPISLLCNLLQSVTPEYAVVKVRSNGPYKTRTIVKLFEKIANFQKRDAKCDAYLIFSRKSLHINVLRYAVASFFYVCHTRHRFARVAFPHAWQPIP